MSLLSLLFRRRAAIYPEPVPPPPRELNVNGCHTVVTFDDGTQARYTHYGSWFEFEGFRGVKTDIKRTGVFHATQFVNDSDPIYLGYGHAYPRHRVVAYDLEAFAYSTRKSTIRGPVITYPYTLPEPVQAVDAS